MIKKKKMPMSGEGVISNYIRYNILSIAHLHSILIHVSLLLKLRTATIVWLRVIVR